MSGQVVTETVTDKEAGVRLDRWVKRRMPLSQGQVEKMLRTGQIRVDGGRAKSNTRLQAGMAVRLPPYDVNAEPRGKRPQDASGSVEDARYLRDLIIYEDEDMFALNKPAGVAVQGGSKQKKHIDGMLGALSEDGHRPKLVHRLDKDTSGVLLIARHPRAASRLADLFKSRDMQKVYWAVTVGVPNPPFGQIRGWMVKGVPDEDSETGFRPISPRSRGHRDADRERMIQSTNGVDGARHAITDYATVSTAAQRAAWVALRPQTGRMHQLRFHMHEIGTSILGDRKYETRREVPQGLAHGLHLHARSLIIPRKTGKPIEVTAPLSGTMKETFETLGFLEREAGKDPQEPFL